MGNISRPSDSGSLSPDGLYREPYDRTIHNFSSLPVKQEPQNEIKVEETSHELPKKILFSTLGYAKVCSFTFAILLTKEGSNQAHDSSFLDPGLHVEKTS
jgi:hypothetical protein